MTRRLAVLALLLSLSACALQPVRLQHPETGKAINCGGTYWSWGYWLAKGAQDECVKTFETGGYRRTP